MEKKAKLSVRDPLHLVHRHSAYLFLREHGHNIPFTLLIDVLGYEPKTFKYLDQYKDLLYFPYYMWTEFCSRGNLTIENFISALKTSTKNKGIASDAKKILLSTSKYVPPNGLERCPLWLRDIDIKKRERCIIMLRTVGYPVAFLVGYPFQCEYSSSSFEGMKKIWDWCALKLCFTTSDFITYLGVLPTLVKSLLAIISTEPLPINEPNRPNATQPFSPVQTHVPPKKLSFFYSLKFSQLSFGQVAALASALKKDRVSKHHTFHVLSGGNVLRWADVENDLDKLWHQINQREKPDIDLSDLYEFVTQYVNLTKYLHTVVLLESLVV